MACVQACGMALYGAVQHIQDLPAQDMLEAGCRLSLLKPSEYIMEMR